MTAAFTATFFRAEASPRPARAFLRRKLVRSTALLIKGRNLPENGPRRTSQPAAELRPQKKHRSDGLSERATPSSFRTGSAPLRLPEGKSPRRFCICI